MTTNAVFVLSINAFFITVTILLFNGTTHMIAENNVTTASANLSTDTLSIWSRRVAPHGQPRYQTCPGTNHGTDRNCPRHTHSV